MKKLFLFIAAALVSTGTWATDYPGIADTTVHVGSTTSPGSGKRFYKYCDGMYLYRANNGSHSYSGGSADNNGIKIQNTQSGLIIHITSNQNIYAILDYNATSSFPTAKVKLYEFSETKYDAVYKGSNNSTNIELASTDTTIQETKSLTFTQKGLDTIVFENVASGFYYIYGTTTSSNTYFTKIRFETATSYTINYEANGGSGTMSSTINKVAACSFIAPEGKMFAGWKDGEGNSYTVGTNVNGDVTLYAQWATYYTITYSAGTGSGTVPTESNKIQGATFTIAGQGSMVAPSDKVFTGWKDHNNVPYEEGDTYTVGTSNVILTAQWGDAPVAAATTTDSKYPSGTISFAAVGNSLTQHQTYWYNGLKFYEINEYSITADKTKRWKDALGNVPAYKSNITSGSSWGAGAYNMSGLALQAHCLAIHVKEASEIEIIVNMSGSGTSIKPTNLKVFWDETAYDVAYTDATYKTGTAITDTTWTRNINVNNLKLTIVVDEEDLEGKEIDVVKISYTGDPVETPQQSECFIYESVKVSPIYTVTYNLNGGTGTIPTETAKKAGATFEVASAAGITAPSSDKMFDKWSDGTNDYAAGATYIMGVTDVVLTAVWKDKTPTALDNIDADAKAVKRLENGMLVIEKNGVRYNAQGQIVR